MPELRLFRRRWHIATDTFPVVAMLLAVFHTAWLGPYITGIYTLETTGVKYACPQQSLLKAASYGILALFIVSATMEWAIAGMGLRGGPLEESRRKNMRPLLYAEVAAWVLMLIFTIYGTYIVASPNVGSLCWDTNPCALQLTGEPTLSKQCREQAGSNTADLLPPCKLIYDAGWEFYECSNLWLQLGQNYVVENIDNATLADELNAMLARQPPAPAAPPVPPAPPAPPGLDVPPAPPGYSDPNEWPNMYHMTLMGAQLETAGGWECNWDGGSQKFGDLLEANPQLMRGGGACEVVFSKLDELGVVNITDSEACGFDPSGRSIVNPQKWNQCAPVIANATYLYQAAVALVYDTTSDLHELAHVPWMDCLTTRCKALVSAADKCPEWNDMLQLPDNSQKKDFFVSIIYSTWGMLVVQLLAIWIAFNAFPDYEDASGWEGSLRSISRFMCCGKVLERADVEGSEEPASREIAKSLHMLMGGIDLDPSDRVLGLLLVSEQQHRRRQAHALRALEAAAVRQAPAPPGLLKRALSRVSRRSPTATRSGSLDGTARTSSAPQGPTLSGPLGSSPTAALSGSVDLASHASSGPRPLYRQDFLRLRTFVADQERERSIDALVASAGSGAAAGVSGSDGPEAPPLVALGSGNAGAERASASPGSPRVRLDSQYTPMLAPSGCAARLEPPISPQQAADIYTGHHERVDTETLRQAQAISRFAVASYGLQSIIWAKGKRPKACMGNINMCVKCCGGPCNLDKRFRKRNFDAILDITGVAPADLVYVSYVNVTGGVLPYLIMLHRPSKSVVVSLRGTVSMEDLVTDLLSTPVDVSEWLPEWAVEEARRASSEGEDSTLYAHAGIVSSATAVLNDLEERGLLKELLLSKLQRNTSSIRPACQEMERGASRAGTAGGKHAARDDREEEGSESAAEREELAAENRAMLARLSTLKRGAQLHLPLGRAQTIIRRQLSERGWQVVVTGHSLGAAVACMLSFHLRERFPDLKCWAFNPPGGLLSPCLARVAASFCTSVVVGKDVISRLSFATAKRVVDEVVLALARCKRPKLLVFADVLLGRRKRAATTPPTFCSFDAISDEALTAVEGYLRASRLHAASADAADMFPPGRLLYLRPFKGAGPRRTVWDAVWIEAAALMGEGILVSPAMMAHHRMFVVADAFESALAREAESQAAPLGDDEERDVMYQMHVAMV